MVLVGSNECTEQKTKELFLILTGNVWISSISNFFMIWFCYLSRSNLLTNNIVNIERDPEMNRLAAEARRLSMGLSSGYGSSPDPHNYSRASSEGKIESTPNSRKSSSSNNDNNTCNSCHNAKSPPPRPAPINGRRTSDIPIFSRKTSEGLGLGNNRRSSNGSINGSESGHRKTSSECDSSELQQRRLSEAGLRRSSTSDVVLNENTSSLMVGMRVWVDGTKPGIVKLC